MIDAAPRRCRWIDGDPRAGGRQCPERAIALRPYCTVHMRRAYRPAVPRVVAELDVDARTTRAVPGPQIAAPVLPDPFE
jgi:GcrA cell cycle regulator